MSLDGNPVDYSHQSMEAGSVGEELEAERILLEAANEIERLRPELSESNSHTSFDDDGDGGMAEANVVEGAESPLQRALDQDRNRASTQVMSRPSSSYSSAAAAGRSGEPSEPRRDSIMLQFCPPCGTRGSADFPLGAKCEMGCERRFHQQCSNLFQLGGLSACLWCAFFTSKNPHGDLVFRENSSGTSISLHKAITCSTCSEFHQGVICSSCNRAMCSSCHVFGAAVRADKFGKNKKIITDCTTPLVCYFCNGPDKHRQSLDERVSWMIRKMKDGPFSLELRADIEQSLADLIALSLYKLFDRLMLAVVDVGLDLSEIEPYPYMNLIGRHEVFNQEGLALACKNASNSFEAAKNNRLQKQKLMIEDYIIDDGLTRQHIAFIGAIDFNAHPSFFSCFLP
jgi:hypothetical protein